MAEDLFCWVSEIPARREVAVRAYLAGIGNNFKPGTPLALSEIDTLHFASITLYAPRCGNPLLFFECSIDKPFDDFVKAVEANCRTALDAIYEGCEGYPVLATGSDEGSRSTARVKYLSSGAVLKRPQLFHVGHPERPVATIRADIGLRTSLEGAFASLPNKTAAEVLEETSRQANSPNGRVRCRPNHPAWDRMPVPAVPLREVGWLVEPLPWKRINRGLGLLGIGWLVGAAFTLIFQRWVFTEALVAILFVAAYGLVHKTSSGARLVRGLIVALPLAATIYVFATRTPAWLREPGLTWAALALLVPALFLLAAYMRIRFVLRPTSPPPDIDPQKVAQLLEAEDRTEHSVYNHVFGLSELRPDWTLVRLLRTRLVLMLLNLFYRVQFVKGQLVSVPTIHFAQWNLVHNRYLLFNVHYDGGADRYLDDFFESLAKGVGFIWFDTKFYPRVSDPRRLKAWVRQSQTLPLVRYRAAVYEDRTVADINNNTRIRRRLLRPRARHAERWLARFTTTLHDDPKWIDAIDRRLRRIAPNG